MLTIIKEASANATAQEKSVDKVKGTVENKTNSVNLKTSTKIYNSRLNTPKHLEDTKTSSNNDRWIFMVDNNQILNQLSKDIYSLAIFHQNIRGLRSKTFQLISSMFPNLPHILCFSEHHLKQFKLDHFNIDNYELGTSYCRKFLGKGGVCIFVHKNLNYSNIKLQRTRYGRLCTKAWLYLFYELCNIDH